MAVWLMVDEDIKGGSRDVLQDWKRYPDGSQFRQSRSSQDWKDKVRLSEESKTVVGNTGHDGRHLLMVHALLLTYIHTKKKTYQQLSNHLLLSLGRTVRVHVIHDCHVLHSNFSFINIHGEGEDLEVMKMCECVCVCVCMRVCVCVCAVSTAIDNYKQHRKT